MWSISQTEIYKFLSQFTTAYRVVAPQGAELPYLVYNMQDNNFAENFILGVTLFSESSSFLELTQIVEKLENEVPQIGSTIISNEKGNISISRGNPFIQDYPQNEETSIKAVYINLQVMLNITQ